MNYFELVVLTSLLINSLNCYETGNSILESSEEEEEEEEDYEKIKDNFVGLRNETLVNKTTIENLTTTISDVTTKRYQKTTPSKVSTHNIQNYHTSSRKLDSEDITKTSILESSEEEEEEEDYEKIKDNFVGLRNETLVNMTTIKNLTTTISDVTTKRYQKTTPSKVSTHNIQNYHTSSRKLDSEDITKTSILESSEEEEEEEDYEKIKDNFVGLRNETLVNMTTIKNLTTTISDVTTKRYQKTTPSKVSTHNIQNYHTSSRKLDSEDITKTTSRTTSTSIKWNDNECEFPPVTEEDFTRMRRKRLTTDALVCLEDYPYTVSIRVSNEHRCGGAIVSRLWILSVAECFDYVLTEQVTLRIRSVFRDYGGRLLSATKIKIHPQYKIDQLSPMHNIALVKVNVPIVFGLRSQPVPLPAEKASLPADGQTFVTGFGAVTGRHVRAGLEQEMRKMEVWTLPKAECRRLYGSDYHLQYDHMCLQSAQGVSLCEGDIGDPAVNFNGVDSRGTIFGVAVFAGGSGTCFNQSYGVYTQIAPSRPWIDTILSDNDSEESTDSNESVTKND